MTSLLFWATRPCHQNSVWQQQLAELGEVLAVPLLAIAPLTEADDCQAIKNYVADLDHYQHVIFVSQNAVAAGFEWINNRWPQLPSGVIFYAIGAKTAEAMRQYCDEVTECGEAMNSEALLQVPTLQAVAQQKVLIFRGQGGRTLLADALRARGARVDLCELYARQLPAMAKVTCAQLEPSRRHVVPVFSGDSLVNLVQVLPSHINKKELQLIVPAQRVADMARDEGFCRIAVAQNASEAAMLACIRECTALASF